MNDFSFSDTDQVLWLFHFNASGVFIGSGLTTIPANTGLPANTTLERCEPPSGETGIWHDGAWHYVKDNRGVRYWDKYGHGYVVTDINEVIPTDAIVDEPPKKESGFVLLFDDGVWHKIEDKTGQKYYGNLGETNVVPDAYFALPDGCTFTPPIDKKIGFATQWNGNEWVYVEDNRGITVYEKSTGKSLHIDYLGPIHDEHTLLAPTTQYDEWDGQAWVVNAAALKEQQVKDATQKRYALRVEADSEIAVLQDAVKFGLATEAEVSKLEAWERYRVALMRIDSSLAPDITWPIKP